jgi:hypothetical protein
MAQPCVRGASFRDLSAVWTGMVNRTEETPQMSEGNRAEFEFGYLRPQPVDKAAHQ